MQSLRLIIASEARTDDATTSATTTTMPVAEIADFIASRFLGVLTYFGLFIPTNLERQLQAEMLLSLGDLIRFLGSKHITPFRFKILTILQTALGIDRPSLRDICAQVWKIFIYTTDIPSMGPLLSTILVSLAPLSDTHAAVVDELLRYLIISNGSLLSIYITDLFFIADTKCSDAIKSFVAQHSPSASFESRFQLYAKQINHGNMDVRCHALRYLTKLFQQHRRPLNALIVGQQQMNGDFEELLQCLMVATTRHTDPQIQLAAGACLGAIGAIEPSLLSTNYAPQTKLALSIHTDAFSTMALSELCRAYQAQKDTQRVDGFSLAIQEILMARGVCPSKGHKIEVWNAIPERMRQLMEPLLRSCYTSVGSQTRQQCHPLFGNQMLCATSDDWAYQWAIRLIDGVEDGDTKYMLNSFKSAIRNDSNVSAMFLPYILVHSLQSGNETTQRQIREELQCVFAVAAGSDGGDGVVGGGGGGNRRSAAEMEVKCCKMAFQQLDFLDRWLRQCQTSNENKDNAHYLRVESFLTEFDKRYLARANFAIGEFARALIYLEQYIEGAAATAAMRSMRLQEELSFLTQIYAELMDSDSVEGALAAKDFQHKPTLAELVLLNKATGRVVESTFCFEKMLQSRQVILAFYYLSFITSIFIYRFNWHQQIF